MKIIGFMSDGRHIEILLLSLFLNFLPELIKQGKVYTVQSPLFKTTTAREIKYWYEDNKEYRQYVRTHKLISLKRMKGLGEMPPQELYETTMDPNNRHLLQLTTEDIQKTLDLYSDLMGDKPSLRRDFILKNKFDDEDEYFEDDSEE